MAVGIAEIKTLPAMFPGHPPFYLYVVRHQVQFPMRQLFFRHCQPDMQWPVAVVRGNISIRIMCPFKRITLDKQQQCAFFAHVVSAKALVGHHSRQL
ncbi:hypothetical protein D3C79_988930 [compost metagenome]